MTKSPEFKREAVHGLRCINEFGHYYTIDGIYTKSVRSLVSLLGISTSTLYRWDTATEFITLTPDQFIPTQEEELEEAYEEAEEDKGFEAYTPYVDEIAEDEDEPHLLLAMMKDVGFWQSLARAMKIPNYRERTNQLKLKIGMALIRETGIVESEINHLRV